MLILYRRQTKETVIFASKEVSATHNKALTAATYTATAAPTAPSAIKVVRMRVPWRVGKTSKTHTSLSSLTSFHRAGWMESLQRATLRTRHMVLP